ncbi:MAG: Ig-like domain-containing protein, partial [Bacteroidales bacterium]|nr:Ig-like domain-containing protein [Bacteroidales bacterium]
SFLPVNHNQPGTVNWSTSDETVAIVSHTGVVTAVAEGTCTITAHFGNLTATCAVTVTKKTETP